MTANTNWTGSTLPPEQLTLSPQGNFLLIRQAEEMTLRKNIQCGILFLFLPTVLFALDPGLLENRVTALADERAGAAYDLLRGQGVFKKATREELLTTSFPVKEKTIALTGELTRFFNWNELDQVISELNRVGIHYSGTLSPKVDYLLVGENASPAAIKTALRQGIPLLDEERFYQVYRKTFSEKRTRTLEDRYQSAMHIALSLGRQMARDVFYHGLYKTRLNQFVGSIELNLSWENKDLWCFVVSVPAAGPEVRFTLEIDKKSLKVGHVESNL
jgi:hypothetical protein